MVIQKGACSTSRKCSKKSVESVSTFLIPLVTPEGGRFRSLCGFWKEVFRVFLVANPLINSLLVEISSPLCRASFLHPLKTIRSWWHPLRFLAPRAQPLLRASPDVARWQVRKANAKSFAEAGGSGRSMKRGESGAQHGE